MPEITGDKAELKRRQDAVGVFVGSLVKGSRTISLYHAGHSVIPQVVGRVNQLLRAAIGEEPNLMLEVKAKSVLFEEGPLNETPEVVSLAASLHTLGIGQVLFTNRLTDEGMTQFMGILVWKPDEKRTLTDLQKAIQELRIDGMQLVSIMSFVVTGEQDEAQQEPGKLSEEQITAFTSAKTLPDFLHLLAKQNEPLTSKDAESISTLLDQVLYHDISLEQFLGSMPWSFYDPRIRACWDRFQRDLGGRKKWDRHALASQLTTFDANDLAALQERQSHEAKAAFRYALSEVHAILAKPAGDKQPKFALYAYARLLADLGRTGNLPPLLKEYEMWHRLASDPKWGSYLAILKTYVQDKVPTPALAQSMAAHLGAVEPGSEALQELHDFVLTVGRKIVPLLLDEIRRAADKQLRKKLSSLLAAVSRPFGPKALIDALGDEDYFLVVEVIGILDEMHYGEIVKHVAPLLRHQHPKVRGAAVRAAGRAGGPDAVEALASFIASGRYPEEAKLAVTALSLIGEPDVDARLIDSYHQNQEHQIRLAVVTALGRLPSALTRDFLEGVARRTWREWLNVWREWIPGAKKSLRLAALASLNQIEEESPSHGASR
ncbi:MAG: HEAT repeat domain-containing protein [Elusimicrobiota bacterium]